MDPFYITTTLPYVNAEPHIGHALEFIQADVIARYQRLKKGNDNVFFNIGTDEHGLKMFTKAKEEGLETQAFVDKYAQRFKDFCRIFQIDYDNFYRTSDKTHHDLAQEFWKASEEAGDIYKKKYEGLYCVGCEEFKTEKDLIDGKCPDHGTLPIQYSEENYFFRLSKYRENLLQWLGNSPEVLKPAHKLSELRNWIQQMEDISISRLKESLPWGIDVPGDEKQVFYVWFDALTNYTNVIEQLVRGDLDRKTEATFAEWWPGVQIFGPDNLRFQCAIWQGMLASRGYGHSKKLLCHGMILASDGTKMSKTKGNVVSPYQQAERYGFEAVRYYLITGISTYGDSAYKEDDLVNMYNANLANNFGNLLNRVIHLSSSKGITISGKNMAISNPVLASKVEDLTKKAESAYEDFELQIAAEAVNELANIGNEYITENAPWEKNKDADDVEKVLKNLGYILSKIIELYEPIIPVSASKAKVMLTNQEKGILFTRLEHDASGIV